MNSQTTEQLSQQARELLASYLNKYQDMKAKERTQIPFQDMPVQDASVRRQNLDEVALGYTMEQARVEAMRCLQCVKRQCVEHCPVKIDIPRFIAQVADGEFAGASETIKQSSLLPAVCGRVCPQEVQCQSECTVGKALKNMDKAVAIGRLERFVADYERKIGHITVPEVKPDTGKKVAVVGSGPAGLVVAADCRREGHQVTVFEAFHKPGGVLRYGIPEFRLPNEIIDHEVEVLKRMGIEFIMNYVVGRTRKLNDLISKDGYDAVFVGTGAGLPLFMGIEGESLVGVFSANEYLTRANLMQAFDRSQADTPIFPSKKVAVLGGGNVAMDASRLARRLGASEVYVVYRRTEHEMPARREEVMHAKEEGIEFRFLQNAKRILGNEEGKVIAIECLRYELGEPDTSGRRRPVEVPGSEFIMEVDTVIVAIGNGSNPLISQTTPEMKVNSRGNILVDEDQQTSMKRIFAGGDIVLGAATVILAMGEGRRAAAAINKMLSEEAEGEASSKARAIVES